MNKKILTIVLVVLLAMTCVFAYKGEMQVGLNLGSGFDGYGMMIDKDTTKVSLYNGLYAAGTFQYGLTDSLYAKAEVGVNTFFRFISAEAGEDPSSTDTDSRTPNVLVSAALVYDIPIGRIFAIDLQIGVDSIIGKPSYGSETFNASIGLGFGSSLVFNITDDLSISSNSKLAVYFVNTNSAYRDALTKGDVVLVGVQNNVGITYSL